MSMMRWNGRFGIAPQSWWGGAEDLSRDIFNLLDMFGGSGRDLRSAAIPKLTVEDTDDAYIVKAALPGYDPESLDAEVVGDFLTLRGERYSPQLADEERYIHRERAADHLEETIKLPGRVVAGQVKAEYRHGILTVTLPREAEVKPQAIRVEVAK